MTGFRWQWWAWYLVAFLAMYSDVDALGFLGACGMAALGVNSLWRLMKLFGYACAWHNRTR